MGDVTITIPAGLAGLFRDNVLHRLEMRADSLEVVTQSYVLHEDAKVKRSREDVLAERDKLRALEPILDQTGWLASRDAPSEELKITGDKEVLARLFHGCLCDVGPVIGDYAERVEVQPQLLAALDQANWLVAKLDELDVDVDELGAAA